MGCMISTLKTNESSANVWNSAELHHSEFQATGPKQWRTDDPYVLRVPRHNQVMTTGVNADGADYQHQGIQNAEVLQVLGEACDSSSYAPSIRACTW